MEINQYNREGYMHGYWEHRNYIDNRISAEGTYNNGIDDGYWKAYWSNGNLLFEGNYVMGIRKGLWKWYTMEGQLDLTTYYL